MSGDCERKYNLISLGGGGEDETRKQIEKKEPDMTSVAWECGTGAAQVIDHEVASGVATTEIPSS